MTAGYRHTRNERRRRETEIAARVYVNGRNIVNRIHRRQQQREEAAEKDEEDGGKVADAEPENGNRNPRQRRDGPKELNERIEVPSPPGDTNR